MMVIHEPEPTMRLGERLTQPAPADRFIEGTVVQSDAGVCYRTFWSARDQRLQWERLPDDDGPVPYIPTQLDAAQATIDRLVLDLARLTGVSEGVVRLRYALIEHAPGCRQDPDRDPYIGCECGATGYRSPDQGARCQHCDRSIDGNVHTEGGYRGKRRCDPADSGLPYGYEAHTHGAANPICTCAQSPDRESSRG